MSEENKKKSFIGSIAASTTFLGWILLVTFEGILGFLTGQFFKKIFSKKKKKEEQKKEEIETDPFDDLKLGDDRKE
jgi:hypothetical protein